MKHLELNQLIDKLTAIYLTQGVQPSELADAIFEESYLSMSSKKNFDSIEVILSFQEKCDITHVNHIRNIRYTYNLERYVLKIEESEDSKKYQTIWDRESIIQNLVNEIKGKLSAIGYEKEKVNKIMNTLPKDIKNKRFADLKLVS